MNGLAAQFLALAEKQRSTAALMIGHRLMGTSSLGTGNLAQARAHFDRAIARYDPAAHRPLAIRFGQDVRVAPLLIPQGNSPVAAWLSPSGARRFQSGALNDAHASAKLRLVMYALGFCILAPCRLRRKPRCNQTRLSKNSLVDPAEEKGTLYWKAAGMVERGCVFAGDWERL